MQLVVEISEDTFFDLKKKQNRTEVDNALLNGTPLPKGHGRLGDLDALKQEMINGINAGNYEDGYDNYSHINNIDDCVECVEYAPTIIEADKEE